MLKVGDYYHNYEKIGKGSYSTVYKGYHKNLYREVAIKQIDIVVNKKNLPRFKTEIQLMEK